MLSVKALNPAMVSLKAINVPEEPIAEKAREVFDVKMKLFRKLPTWAAVKPEAMPEEEFKVIPASPGRSRMSPTK